VFIDLMRMTTRLVTGMFAACAALLCGGAYAQSAIYKCVDAAGRVEFTDVKKSGCKSLDLPGSYPAPVRRAGAASRQGSAPAPIASPADFPRVEATAQKARDDDRRGILNEELRAEETKLASLKAAYNGSEAERQGADKNNPKLHEKTTSMKDDITRAERNLEALRRELSNIR